MFFLNYFIQISARFYTFWCYKSWQVAWIETKQNCTHLWIKGLYWVEKTHFNITEWNKKQNWCTNWFQWIDTISKHLFSLDNFLMLRRHWLAFHWSFPAARHHASWYNNIFIHIEHKAKRKALTSAKIISWKCKFDSNCNGIIDWKGEQHMHQN